MESNDLVEDEAPKKSYFFYRVIWETDFGRAFQTLAVSIRKEGINHSARWCYIEIVG